MIRRYLPRRTPVAPSMARELQETVDETDNRPMRVLGCRTPPRRGIRRRTARISREQGCCTYK